MTVFQLVWRDIFYSVTLDIRVTFTVIKLSRPMRQRFLLLHGNYKDSVVARVKLPFDELN